MWWFLGRPTATAACQRKNASAGMIKAMDNVNVSAGEVGGVVAGIVAGAAAIAKGVAWLLNWNDARRGDKEDRLAAWEKSLAEREKAYREEIEHRLDQVQADLAKANGVAERLNSTVSTLVFAVADLTSELESHAPQALSLIRARQLLETLKIRPSPADLEQLANRVDAANSSGH